MEAYCVDKAYIDEDVYMPEEIHPDDLGEYDAVEVVVIGG